MTALGSKPGLRGKKAGTSRLHHGTTSPKFKRHNLNENWMLRTQIVIYEKTAQILISAFKIIFHISASALV